MCFDIPSQWWTREEAAVASRHRKENFSLNENSYLRAICKPNIYACLLIARERRGIRLMGINWYRESFPRRSPSRRELFAFSFYLFFLLLLIEASSSQLHVVLIPRVHTKYSQPVSMHTPSTKVIQTNGSFSRFNQRCDTRATPQQEILYKQLFMICLKQTLMGEKDLKEKKNVFQVYLEFEFKRDWCA